MAYVSTSYTLPTIDRIIIPKMKSDGTPEVKYWKWLDWKWDNRSYFATITVPEEEVLEPSGNNILNNFYIGFNSNNIYYKTYQVQYRTRKRLSSALVEAYRDAGTLKASMLGDDGRYWTDWEDWIGDISDPHTANVWAQGGGALFVNKCFDHLFTFHDSDLEQYDRIELEVRLRVYNEPDTSCSDWVTAKIIIVKKINITSIKLCYGLIGKKNDSDENYDLHSNLESSRPVYCRPYFLIDTDSDDSYPPKEVHVDYYGYSSLGLKNKLNPSGLRRVVANNYSRSHDIVVPITSYGTTDYHHDPQAKVKVVISVATFIDPYVWAFAPKSGYIWLYPEYGEEQESIPDPIVETSSNNSTLTITVKSASPSKDDYDSVSGSLSYNGLNGVPSNNTLDFTSDDSGVWTVDYEYPPFDIDINITIACIKDGEYKIATATARVDSNGSFSLDWANEHIEVHWDRKINVSNTRNVDNKQVIGRDRPISRYGFGGARSFDISGKAVYDAYEVPQTRSDFDVLWNPHDWWLRLPGGIKAKVQVKSWSVDDTKYDNAKDVSIKCEEVD